MNARDLIAHLEPVDARAVGDLGGGEITGVSDDSRTVAPGHVFVAVPGMTVDGHDFIADAAARGAVLAVVERPSQSAIPEIVVTSAARALGLLAAAMARNPADRLTMIGITGTNGKTTTTYLVEAILAAAGHHPAVLGTVGYRWGGREHPAPYTTPTPIVLHAALADAAAAGSTHAILEVSSAALAMDRMAGVTFDVAAFSNLTQDHLDLHGTMAQYQAAKERLFSDHLRASACAAINIDDPAAGAMARAAAPARILRVSTSADADITARAERSTIDGIACTVTTPSGGFSVESAALIGHYNLANIALAVAIAEALAIPHAAIAAGISAMAGVPGRVERVANDAGLDILVDYAHTPDALANVLDAVRPLTRRRLICVFGCGGDRDPGKRPKMGAAVAERADVCVVTSDNPRTEDPQAILDMILPAVPQPFFVDVDRRTAIRAAIFEAVPGDIVVIAGKGHEDYQILGTDKIHFDDREQAAEAATARMTMTAGDIARECGGQLSGSTDAVIARVVIDSRKVAPGDAYVAIRGENYDGHRFCEAAVDAGAAAIIVDTRGEWPASVGERATIIQVDDTRDAIAWIARAWQRAWRSIGANKILIGVTGSAGKTTTKDLIAAGLSPVRRVHKSEGSLNNETGVPLTLLGLRPHHDAAVIEMGMRGLGQIAALADIAEPDIGVVVNAGVAHIGILGSAEAIVRAKSEMFSHLSGPRIAVCPADDPRLIENARAADRLITFGDEGDVTIVSDVRAPAPDIATDITLRIFGETVAFRSRLIGYHSAENAACAMAAVIASGIDPKVAAAGLARARPATMRGEVENIGGRMVIIDCYNANPLAVVRALDTLHDRKGTARAVAILGDMLELGDHAAVHHRDIGAAAAARGIHVIATGELATTVAEAATSEHDTAEVASDPAHAATLALAATSPGDWILVKASRGARLERAVQAMRKATT